MLEPVDKLTDEQGRLAALRRTSLLDTCREEAFDKITRLVRSVLRVPIAAVSLIDSDRQWFKSIDGLDSRQTPRSIAFCAHTILQREPLVIEDAAVDERFKINPLVTGEPGVRSYAGVPLSSADGYNLGALCAIDTVPRQFDASDLELLRNFAALIMDEMELRTIAQVDGLTGVLTRGAFLDQATRELERLRRYRRPLSLLLFDLDHFKGLNDSFGHQFGDEVLASSACAVKAALRPMDLIGRYGGEEFAVLLPETSLSEGLLCAERLRESIATLEIGRPVQVTASFGVSGTVGAADTLSSLISQADAALYVAKRSGRNKCSSVAEIMDAA